MFWIFLVVIALIALFSWYRWDRRYRGAEEGNFEPTDEMTVDARTGVKTRVWFDPKTGRRQYRKEA